MVKILTGSRAQRRVSLRIHHQQEDHDPWLIGDGVVWGGGGGVGDMGSSSISPPAEGCSRTGQ